MKMQLACKKKKRPHNFVSKQKTLLTVVKTKIIETGIAYTAVQTFSTVNFAVLGQAAQEGHGAFLSGGIQNPPGQV